MFDLFLKVKKIKSYFLNVNALVAPTKAKTNRHKYIKPLSFMSLKRGSVNSSVEKYMPYKCLLRTKEA